jgi:peptidoglycan pentaglycine glycine transferase (the first glycine)
MNRPAIRAMGPEDRIYFNRLVMSEPHHSLLQSWEWGELKSTFGWQAHRLVIGSPDGELPLSVLSRKTPVLPRSMLYSPHCSLSKEHLVGYLTQNLKERFPRAISWKVEPIEGSETSYLGGLGFVAGARIQPKSTLQLDLTQSEEELSTNLEMRTRYNVGLAQRRGVEVHEENGEEGYQVFIRLLQETSKRKGFLVHSEPYYRRMYELFVQKGPGMILNSYYQGEPTASAFILRFGRYAYYALGASSPRHSKHKSTQLLQWRAILWAKADGAEVYDFWGIPEDPQPSSHLWGVYTFKAGFGGRVVTRPGALDLPIKRVSYGLGRCFLSVYNGLRNFRARGSFRDPLET